MLPVVQLPGNCRRLLLHSCCAPCSGAIIECLLHSGIRPAIFFSNSNITPFAEYSIRRDEIERYARENALEFIDDDYDHHLWVQGNESFEGCGSQRLRSEPERGERCLQCFKFRLLRAARYAAANGYDALATSLASSRWKDLSQVDEALLWACSQVEGVTAWTRNWRKGGLQERRSQIIREQGFYNQLFCGCEFSPRKED